jgi:hypothetical protein
MKRASDSGASEHNNKREGICISHTTTTKIDTRRAIGIFGKHYDRFMNKEIL